jgi:hypothetical protein
VFGDEELDGFVELDGELLEDELFMSVPCDAGELDVSVVWPVEVFASIVELVELPMVPLEEPLTEPLPVCDESTGPSAPEELLVPLVEVSEPVDGAAGRTRSLPLVEVEPAVSPADDELDEVLLSGLVVLELDEV